MRGLIFDYDGLMVDSEGLAARLLIEAFAERGVEASMADVAPFVGSTGFTVEDAWGRWIGSLVGEAEVEAFSAELWRRIDAALPSLELVDGVEDLIASARSAGWRVGLGTGQSRPRLEAGLRRLGVFDRFDAIVTAGEVGKGKPAPDIFLEVARRLGVEPSECVVLEDSVPGCLAALAAGMKAIACPCEVTSGSEFPSEAFRVNALTEVDLAAL